jgi:hypothetical protein
MSLEHDFYKLYKVDRGSSDGMGHHRFGTAVEDKLETRQASITIGTTDYMYHATFSKSLFLANNFVIFKGSNSLTSMPRGPEPPAEDCV